MSEQRVLTFIAFRLDCFVACFCNNQNLLEVAEQCAMQKCDSAEYDDLAGFRGSSEYIFSLCKSTGFDLQTDAIKIAAGQSASIFFSAKSTLVSSVVTRCSYFLP